MLSSPFFTCGHIVAGDEYLLVVCVSSGWLLTQPVTFSDNCISLCSTEHFKSVSLGHGLVVSKSFSGAVENPVYDTLDTILYSHPTNLV